MWSWLRNKKVRERMIDYLTDKTYKAGAYVRLSIEDDNRDIESVSITNQRAFIKNMLLRIILKYMITM